MKAGEKPQFSSKWWTANKAKALAKELAMDKALAACETAEEAFHKDCTSDKNLDVWQKAVAALPAVIAATIKKCNVVAQKETIDCLKKFDPLIKNLLRDMKSEASRRGQINKMVVKDFLFGAFSKEFKELCKARFMVNDYEYLTTLKDGKAGTAKEFNKFIMDGSPMEVNITDQVRNLFTHLADQNSKAIAAASPKQKQAWQKTPRRDLSKAPWKAVHEEMVRLMNTNLGAAFKKELKAPERMLASLR